MCTHPEFFPVYFVSMLRFWMKRKGIISQPTLLKRAVFAIFSYQMSLLLENCPVKMKSIFRQFLIVFFFRYEGAIEGPEEFMSGLGSGIQSLVGKSVGGVLGTGRF